MQLMQPHEAARNVLAVLIDRVLRQQIDQLPPLRGRMPAFRMGKRGFQPIVKTHYRDFLVLSMGHMEVFGSLLPATVSNRK